VKTRQILLAHGDGGKLTRSLIEQVFAKAFSNPELNKLEDSALLQINTDKIAFTTDSYTVKPIFFPESDIGKLAVYGTANDLAVMGARPLYLSCGFIIEEGLEMDVLEKIVLSMKESAQQLNIKLVTGDTKVVERGSVDKIFINTSGIGELLDWESMGRQIEPEDEILVSGTIGDHGIAILSARGELELEMPVKSDCAPVWELVNALYENKVKVKWMRDPTRGGLASALNELVEGASFGIELYENKIPITPPVDSACEILGLDPLYLANEGKIVCVVEKGEAERAREIMHAHKLGKDAEIIGKVIETPSQKVIMRTQIGGTRIIGMLAGRPLPRIC